MVSHSFALLSFDHTRLGLWWCYWWCWCRPHIVMLHSKYTVFVDHCLPLLSTRADLWMQLWHCIDSNNFVRNASLCPNLAQNNFFRTIFGPDVNWVMFTKFFGSTLSECGPKLAFRGRRCCWWWQSSRRNSDWLSPAWWFPCNWTTESTPSRSGATSCWHIPAPATNVDGNSV